MATRRIKIDGTYAPSLLTECVQEEGAEYVYPRDSNRPHGACTYERDGKASCIVGRAMHKAGVSVPRLRNLDHAKLGSTAIGNLAGYGVLDRRGITLTQDAVRIFRAAQIAQDSGNTWGSALKAAREVA